MIEALYKKIIIFIILCFSCIFSSTNTLVETKLSQNYIFNSYIPYQESKFSLGVNLYKNNNSIDYMYLFNSWFKNNLYLSGYLKPIKEKFDLNIKYNLSLGFAFNFKDKKFNNLIFKLGYDKSRFSNNMDNKNINIKINNSEVKEIKGGFSLSVGNPHIVFFVKDLNKFNLEEIGPKIENHSYFPEKCNVTLASIKNKGHVKVKVWERGAGLTKACGTAACAAAVSGAVLKLNERCIDIEFPEGLLNIDWKKNNDVYMTGVVSEVKKITVNI